MDMFQTQAHAWWDEEGPFKALHRITPLRMEWILDQLMMYNMTFSSMRVMDVGCGGGLLTEPMARLGAKVMGIDASPEALECAREHAHQQGLEIDYGASLDDFPVEERHQEYDLITMMELLEHVADPFFLLKTYTEKIKPGGMLLGSTFNRTGLSYLLGIVMAEKVLRWIPRDTHQWGYFLKPSELNTMLLALGFQHIHIQGFGYVPFQWKLSKCTSVNYFFSAQKKAEIS